MAERNDIIKLAIDAYTGKVAGNFSQNDTMSVLRQAMIDANNGSTKLDYKAIRDGKCNGLFTIIEEILQKTVVEGLRGDEFFFNMVEYKNLALGDENKFYVPDTSLFVVADTAEGTQGIRRQRLNAGTTTTVSTQLKQVKIYEELNRVLAGSIDFNEFIDRVGESFKQKAFSAIYDAWTGVTASTLGATYYPTAGSYSETALLTLISHVEAATGKSVTIVGTKAGLRKLTGSVVADSAKEDMYNIGYWGKFNGTPMVMMKQAHKVGTDTFMLDDDIVYVIATGAKPIKFVTEGDSLLMMGNPMDNADLSQEFLYSDRFGVGVIITEKFGVYEMTA